MNHIIHNKLQAIADKSGNLESLHDYYCSAFHDANSFLHFLTHNIAADTLDELDTKETFNQISILMMLVNDYQHLANMIDDKLRFELKNNSQTSKVQ